MAESLIQKLPAREAMLAEVEPEALSSAKWQERLLPLMTRMVIGLTVFFFVASPIQLAYLHWSISQSPELDMREPLAFLSPDSNATTEEMLAASRLKVLAALEANVLERRYHQANVLLMSSVWIRYLAFVTGMILALVGSSFILGKLQEPLSEIAGKSRVAEFSFRSTSPGVILAGLGVILMLTTMIMQHEITVRDAPLFLQIGDSSLATPEISNAPHVDSLKLLDSSDSKDESIP